MLKIDLHTHSAGSADGSLTAADYAAAISGGLNYVAITDHNDVATAQAIKQQLGKPIIVGEEIMTDSGEIIGLFLSSKIEPFQSLSATVKAIKDQQALVYVPHPFDKLRRAGLSQSSLESIAADIDIIEIKNGRSLLPLHGSLAARLGRRHGWSPAASSDAHGPKGLGRTYSLILAPPTRANLKSELLGAKFVRRLGLGGLGEPAANRRGKIKPNR